MFVDMLEKTQHGKCDAFCDIVTGRGLSRKTPE